MRKPILQFRLSFFVFSLLFIICFVSACSQKPVKRQYEEITLDSPLENQVPANDPHPFLTALQKSGMSMEEFQKVHGNMKDMPVSADMSMKLTWKVPDAWTEKPGSGIRLATFTADGIECSIVSLGGAAGGLEANAKRWIEQIHIPMPDEIALQDFLRKQPQFESVGKFPVQVLDFTTLQSPKEERAPSMIAAIVNVNDSSVFVKMTGSLKNVSSNREKFIGFCRSLNQ